MHSHLYTSNRGSVAQFHFPWLMAFSLSTISLSVWQPTQNWVQAHNLRTAAIYQGILKFNTKWIIHEVPFWIWLLSWCGLLPSTLSYSIRLDFHLRMYAFLCGWMKRPKSRTTFLIRFNPWDLHIRLGKTSGWNPRERGTGAQCERTSFNAEGPGFNLWYFSEMMGKTSGRNSITCEWDILHRTTAARSDHL